MAKFVGTNVSNLIPGTAGDDLIFGLAGDDTLQGGAGADWLNGGIGADKLAGGEGDDVYVIDSLADSVIEDAAGGIDRIETALQLTDATLFADVENFTFTGGKAVTFAGSDAGNWIVGTAANDALSGLIGDDTLIGGKGADLLAGGAGGDIYYVDNAKDIVDESGGDGIDRVVSSLSFSLAENGATLLGELEELELTGKANISGTGNALQNVILGNAGANRLDGAAGEDSLFGGAGNDTLIGGAGLSNDDLNGGAGADSMDGGEGNDYYRVDNSRDRASELYDDAAGGNDMVESLVSHTLGFGIELLLLTGTAKINGAGNAQDNIMFGNQSANRLLGLSGGDALVGNGGDDTLDGGAGADSLIGAAGNDTYIIDSRNDDIQEQAGEGVDTIISTVGIDLNIAAPDVERVILIGTGDVDVAGNAYDNWIAGNGGNNKLTENGGGNDTLSGGAGNDLLLASWGNDRLLGGSGSDTINGDIGDDTIVGGAGADVILYGMVFHGHDLIAGFDGNAAGGQDILDLDVLFDSLGLAAADRAARVQIIDTRSVVELRVDTHGDQIFDLFVATIRTPDAITVGQDVLLGS
jgi:Ca2+-binding RTX toxin-like protein